MTGGGTGNQEKQSSPVSFEHPAATHGAHLRPPSFHFSKVRCLIMYFESLCFVSDCSRSPLPKLIVLLCHFQCGQVEELNEVGLIEYIMSEAALRSDL